MKTVQRPRAPTALEAAPSTDADRRGGLRLPPLNLLRGFEAVVRHGSFRLAAEELCVTPSAVSQQIRQLETFFGMQLFRRLTRRIELTRDGQVLATTVKDALAILSAGCDRLRDTSVSTVSVNVTPTLGVRWLVGRLKRFMEDNRQIRIALIASNDPLDFARQDVDLGIRWGNGVFSGLVAEPLGADVIFPVCNPAHVDPDAIRAPADLRRYQLLQAVQNGVTWASWLERMGAAGLVPLQDTLTYNDSNIMLEAVAVGQGIGLSNSFLAETDLESGRLVRLFDQDVEIDERYYVLSRPVTTETPAVALVRGWLHREALLSTELVRGRAGRI